MRWFVSTGCPSQDAKAYEAHLTPGPHSPLAPSAWLENGTVDRALEPQR
jgi:hypothetical protein